MIYLHNFKTFNEKYSFPDTLTPILNIVQDEILEILEWFIKNEKTNFSQALNLEMPKEITNNLDFPLKWLDIDFKIEKTDEKSRIWATATHFKSDVDKNLEMDSSTRLWKTRISSKLKIFKNNFFI